MTRSASLLLVAVAFLSAASTAVLANPIWEVPGDAILAVDFGRDGGNGGTAEAGWTVVDVVTESDGGWAGQYHLHTTTVGNITVTLWSDWLKFYDRTGCTDSGDFTWDQVYTDYAYGVYGADLYIELSGAGISPNATYGELYLLHYDSQDGATMEAAFEINGVPVGTHTTDSDFGLIANNDPNGMFPLQNVGADSAGKITILVSSITPGGGAIRVNGLILTPEPSSAVLLILGICALKGRRRSSRAG